MHPPTPSKCSLLSRGAVLVTLLAACAKPNIEPRPAPGRAIETLTITSSVVRDGAQLPLEYSCDGNETLPGLRWSAPPNGAQSLVLLLEEQSSDAEQRTLMLLYHVAPSVSQLAHDALPEGARFGRNDLEVTRYSGPCPARGEGRRYTMRIVAVDTPMDLREGLTRREVDQAMDGHILATGALRFGFGH